MKLTSAEKKIICNYFSDKPIVRAYVFGSYARGDADKNSDVDLLLRLDYSKKIGLKYIRMQLDLEKLLRKKVDFSSEDFLKPQIKKLVDKEKILLYAKTNSRPAMA